MPRALDPATLSPLGRRLLALATSGGHTSLASAARAWELDYHQLLDLARGRFSPRLDTLGRIAAAIGVGVDELVSPPVAPPSRRAPRESRRR